MLAVLLVAHVVPELLLLCAGQHPGATGPPGAVPCHQVDRVQHLLHERHASRDRPEVRAPDVGGGAGVSVSTVMQRWPVWVGGGGGVVSINHPERMEGEACQRYPPSKRG